MISGGDRLWIRWVPETFLSRFPVSVKSLLWPARFSRRFAARGFGLRPKMCGPSADTENSHRTRENPLVPRVGYERWQTSNRETKVLQPLGDCLVLLDLPPLGISVALREGDWCVRGGRVMGNFWNYTHFSFVWAKWLTYYWALVYVACITNTLNLVSVGASLYLSRNDLAGNISN